MNRAIFFGLACTLIFSLAPLTIQAQEKTQDRIKNGTVKFFNETKGFGFVSNGDEVTAEMTARGNGTVKFFNETKGFGFVSNGEEVTAEMTARGNGTVKFFNETKGFGFVSNVPGMDELLQKIAAICGGPATGCTFEIMDILNEVLNGTHGGSGAIEYGLIAALMRGTGEVGGKIVRKAPGRVAGDATGLTDEIMEGDQVSYNLDEVPNESGAPKTVNGRPKVKFKAGADLAGKVN
jgi:cold shock CspA family protein